jgi:DNA transformation protein
MDRETAAELFSAFGAVDVRRMFSGFGVYADDICFALYLRGELYLKADETTIPRFVAEGCEPFSYATRAKTVSVNSYWRMPARLYDEPEELADWARAAVAVAAKVKLTKASRKRSVKKPARAKRVAPKPAKKARATGRSARSKRSR